MMFMQRNSKTVVGYFRPNRKCFSFSGCLIFLCIFMVGFAQQTAARPNQDVDLPQAFDVSNEFKDTDNLEIHRVKVVDGATQEDHPIIIYKEDFVTADYVPPSNQTRAEKHKRHNKDIAHRKRHNKQNFTDIVFKEKPDTLLFDIIPETPIIVAEDMEKQKISHFALEPLVKDLNELNKSDNDESQTNKAELQKKPKKYHQRVRRSANGEHIVRRRNPFFRHVPKIAAETPTQQMQYIYVKHSVAGKKHNGLDIPVPGPTPIHTQDPNDGEPMSFDNRIAADENDRVIVSGSKRITPRPTEAPESIFRDPRPQNFDFSFMNGRRPTTTTTRTPIFTRRPQTTPQQAPESIFRDPRPQNFDFSFMNPQAQQSSFAPARVPSVSTARPQLTTEAAISQCVWAIVNCCSNNNANIRYTCFERNGCYGAFWDLNPCADSVRDRFVNFVAEYFN